ncbi:GntR family transcriptional regulator [Streptomyces sp. MAR4 CNX-425]|uniref:GntR family transcriptional regulator n=1 Tax=Streptomyces sp. MAR4 CNX-425 TaxID=3406343 RepID=UPI003B509E7F
MAVLKYEQIADWIRARITEGELTPGALVPSQRELCERWGVSRATAIKAMDVLRLDGVIDRERQGQGFRVVETPLARPAGHRASGSSRLAGGHPFRRVGRPGDEEPPPHIAQALELGPGGRALRRDRLVVLEDDTPLTYVSAWFPPDVAEACPRLAQAGPLAEGTTHYVTRRTGRPPARGVDTAGVRLATAAEAERLERALPLAVAVELHTAYDGDGRPLVCEEGVTPGELWERSDQYPMGGDH